MKIYPTWSRWPPSTATRPPERLCLTSSRTVGGGGNTAGMGDAHERIEQRDRLRDEALPHDTVVVLR
ncbi:MAG: hypothetical protein LC799_14245, partial [Actinobacteria bacterium]|nr:hypothetical protein [Actinomycetota bacterium]